MSGTQKRFPKEGSLIIGKRCIREVLLGKPEKIKEILAVETDKMGSLVNLAVESGIKVSPASREELSNFTGTESHQGIAALIETRKFWSLKDWIKQQRENSGSLILVLDSIEDPQNFGALLRCAECFGAGGVMWSKNRGCGVTAAVTKSSVGASELVNLIRVSNLARALRELKTNHYWIVAADAGSGSADLWGFEFPRQTALILGSEGCGIHELLVKESDFKVTIPMYGRISSLNVSQAASVFLSYYRAQFLR